MTGAAREIFQHLEQEYASQMRARATVQARAERQGCTKIVASAMMLVVVFPVEPFLFTIGAPIQAHLVVAGFFVLGLLLFMISKRARPADAAPLSYLERVARYLGCSRVLARSNPEMNITVDPDEPLWEGLHGERKWEVTIGDVNHQKVDHERQVTETVQHRFTREIRATNRQVTISESVRLWQVEWVLTIDGCIDVSSKPPVEHVTLVKCEHQPRKTMLTFSLPKNHSERDGLGHVGRKIPYSRQPGQHHPEFVGEAVAGSLLWALSF